jgi:hypothetical protein
MGLITLTGGVIIFTFAAFSFALRSQLLKKSFYAVLIPGVLAAILVVVGYNIAR